MARTQQQRREEAIARLLGTLVECAVLVPQPELEDKRIELLTSLLRGVRRRTG